MTKEEIKGYVSWLADTVDSDEIIEKLSDIKEDLIYRGVENVSGELSKIVSLIEDELNAAKELGEQEEIEKLTPIVSTCDDYFAAEKTDVVKASANGKIKSIKNDPRYGLTVVIEHENGFESIYSSLLTAEFVKVGEEIEQGQTIATVGNTARFEIADETHLHFEIRMGSSRLDPSGFVS